MKYRFAQCELDTERHEFKSGGEVVPVEPQVFDLLAYLAGHPGRLISKDELVEAIWDGRAVSDSAITSRINGARRAVGDDGFRQEIIATVTRRGLRLIAPVEVFSDPTADRAPVPVPPILQAATGTQSAARMTKLPTVGIVPFTLQPLQPDLVYLATGLADEIGSELGRYHSIAVLARHSSQQMVGPDESDLSGLKALDATHGVRGTIQVRGDKLRISVQLIALGRHRLLWAERYDIGREDLFAMQDDAVSRIAEAIIGRVRDDRLAGTRSHPTESLDAYDCVLRGMAVHRGGGYHNITRDQAREALKWYDRAIMLDPMYARAYAWRGCAGVSLWPKFPRQENYDEGHAYSVKAFELDPTDAEANRCMAGISIYLRRFDLGHHHLEKMRALNPNDSQILIKSGLWYNYLGDRDRASINVEQAMLHNPLHASWYWRDTGIVLYDRGDYEGAWTALNLVPAIRHIDPIYRAACLVGLGRMPEAEDQVATLRRDHSDIRLADLSAWMPYRCYKHDHDFQRLRDHLAQAGLT
jgi:DNA-binding winged helix-turn-helix (wHTH) protein/tetratricopeptide (TPR) repeat protein